MRGIPLWRLCSGLGMILPAFGTVFGIQCFLENIIGASEASSHYLLLYLLACF